MNTIELTIKQAPLFKGKIWRKQIEFIEKRVAGEDEKLVAVCFKKDGMQQLYVTNKRIYFNEIKGTFSNDEQTIPLSNVSSVVCSSQGLFADLKIITSGATIIVEDVSVGIAQTVMKEIETLRTQNGVPSTVDSGGKYDAFELADELRELKDLLDEGLLTQEEFDAKKKQLLGV